MVHSWSVSGGLYKVLAPSADFLKDQEVQWFAFRFHRRCLQGAAYTQGVTVPDAAACPAAGAERQLFNTWTS